MDALAKHITIRINTGWPHKSRDKTLNGAQENKIRMLHKRGTLSDDGEPSQKGRSLEETIIVRRVKYILWFLCLVI